MRKGLILAAVALLVAVLAVGCTSKDAEVAATVAAEATATTEATVAVETTVEAEAAEAGAMLELTLEELAAYDGKNGNPAYVAVDGVIYEVTDVKAWNNGEHNGYAAGQDLTDVISKAPHGDSVLKDLTVVGTLKAE